MVYQTGPVLPVPAPLTVIIDSIAAADLSSLGVALAGTDVTSQFLAAAAVKSSNDSITYTAPDLTPRPTGQVARSAACTQGTGATVEIPRGPSPPQPSPPEGGGVRRE